MKPFLLLQLRPNEASADQEYQAFLKFGNLTSAKLDRIRMTKEGVPPVDLNQYSGIFTGGGASNVSDPEEKKTDYQRRFETEIKDLYADICKQDFPFLGTCYGIGSIVDYLGGEISREKYSEGAGIAEITFTDEGRKDPLLKGLSEPFEAVTGHKEACQRLPDTVTVLAQSADCPVHMIRYKNNIYASQFHPELDYDGAVRRVDYYRHDGYFDPSEEELVLDVIKNAKIDVPHQILSRFTTKYARD